MAKSGTLDLASGLGGKIDKKGVLSAVEQCVPFYFSLSSMLFSVTVVPIVVSVADELRALISLLCFFSSNVLAVSL